MQPLHLSIYNGCILQNFFGDENPSDLPLAASAGVNQLRQNVQSLKNDEERIAYIGYLILVAEMEVAFNSLTGRISLINMMPNLTPQDFYFLVDDAGFLVLFKRNLNSRSIDDLRT
ncbi:uncharacterized protein LOC132615625 [Lycium barbarum]|uniref:uncharacterized protein LOC132615625 n=1 Tax=Lycium barbarum TaxID=112863 RepID=UPI00293E9EE9|nr:uncharacterized protein LOC132615625 [Lycium barbarum]